jgi:hypothetical protein
LKQKGEEADLRPRRQKGAIGYRRGSANGLIQMNYAWAPFTCEAER